MSSKNHYRLIMFCSLFNNLLHIFLLAPKTILFTRKIIYTDTCFLFQKRHKADDQVNNRRVKGKITIQLIFRCTFFSLNFACA